MSVSTWTRGVGVLALGSFVNAAQARVELDPLLTDPSADLNLTAGPAPLPEPEVDLLTTSFDFLPINERAGAENYLPVHETTWPSTLTEWVVDNTDSRTHSLSPSVPPALPPVKQAGMPWVSVIGLGYLLLASRRKGAAPSGGGSIHEMILGLPNGRRVSVEIRLDATNRILAANGGLSTLAHWQGADGNDLGNFPVTFDTHRAGRLILTTPDGMGRLPLDLTIHTPRGGSASGSRIVMAGLQPNFTGSNADVMVVRENPADVTVLNVSKVNDVGLSGGRAGGRKTYEITLSNFDILILEIETTHHGAGSYKVTSAQWRRFSSDTDECEDLEVSRGGSGTGGNNEIVLASENSDLEIKIQATMPRSSMGGDVEFNGIEITKNPDVKYQAGVMQSLRGLSSNPVFATAQPSFLVPTAASRRILATAWDDRNIRLEFTGRIGGYVIGRDAPLVLSGRFSMGGFSPQLTAHRAALAFLIREAGGPGHSSMVDGQLVSETERATSTRLELPQPEGGNFVIPGHPLGTMPIFAIDTNGVNQHMIQELGATPLAHESFAATAFVKASDSIRAEVARFMPRDSGPWEDVNVVRQGARDKDLVAVTCENGLQLIFRRHEDGDEIQYEWVGSNQNSAKAYYLTSPEKTQVNLEALVILDDQGQRQWVRPWRGEMTRLSSTPTDQVFSNDRNSVVAQLARGTGQDATLSLRIMKTADAHMSYARLVAIDIDHEMVMVFETDEGGLLRISLPDDVDDEDFLTLMCGTDTDAAIFPCIQIDQAGQITSRGRLSLREGAWVLETPTTCQSLTLVTGFGKGYSLEMRPWQAKEQDLDIEIRAAEITPSLAAESMTDGGEQESQGERTAETDDTELLLDDSDLPTVLPPALTAEDIVGPEAHATKDLRDLADFPWEPQAFMLPSESTRRLMRAAMLGQVVDGETATFEFFGDRHSLDGLTQAGKILAAMKNHGSQTRSYFGWIMRLDMRVRNGRWIPDTQGVLHVERRYDARNLPLGRRGELIPNIVLLDKSGDYPLHPVGLGSGWGIDMGGARTMLPFRVPIVHQGRSFISPDFAISLGEPSDPALSTLANVEDWTLRDAGERSRLFVKPEETTLMFMQAGTHSFAVRPEFGDPYYRFQMVAASVLSIIEFRPGYFKGLPDVRFSQLSGTDGNGLTWQLLFQHSEGRTELRGAVASGVLLESSAIQSEDVGDDKQRVTIVLESPHQLNGPESVAIIPITVVLEISGNKLDVISLEIAETHVEVTGLHFDGSANAWSRADILRPRTGTELNIKVTRVQGRRFGSGRPPVLDPDQPRRNTLATLHLTTGEQRQSLIQGVNAAGISLETEADEHGIPVTFFLPPLDDRQSRSLSLWVRYDAGNQVYVPFPESGPALLTLTEGSRDQKIIARLIPTDTGRNWRIAVDTVGDFYLGNFYVDGCHAPDNRPLPVLWSTEGVDPSRQSVRQALIRERLVLPPQRIQCPTDTDEMTVRLNTGRGIYELPLRTVNLNLAGQERLVVVPRGTAMSLDSGTPCVVNFYPAQRANPAVVVIDGCAFELQVKRSLVPAGHVLQIYPSTPGASDLHSPLRYKTHVRLEPGDQSALLLLDLEPTSWMDTVQVNAEPGLVRRSLWDAISGNTYEFVLAVTGQGVHQHLGILGMARISGDSAHVLVCQTFNRGGRIFVRTEPGGHYVSFPRFPGDRFLVSSHGRVLQAELLQQPWQDVPLREDIFSRLAILPARLGSAKDDTRYFENPENRARARTQAASWAGVDPVLLWDGDEAFPHGMSVAATIDPLDGNYHLFSRQSGELTIRAIMHGHTPVRPEMTLHGETVPVTVQSVGRRAYLILGAPYSGVVFYVNPFNKIIELTHPALREAISRQRGKEPLKRPMRTSWQYSDDSAGSAVEQAVQAQLRK